MQAKVLCFNIAPAHLRALCSAAQQAGAQVQEVPQADFVQTPGALLGILPRASEVCLAPFQEPMLIMAGLAGEQMDSFLAGLRQAGVAVAYKAVVTPTNLTWRCDDLIKELKREHTAIQRMKAKNE